MNGREFAVQTVLFGEVFEAVLRDTMKDNKAADQISIVYMAILETITKASGIDDAETEEILLDAQVRARTFEYNMRFFRAHGQWPEE